MSPSESLQESPTSSHSTTHTALSGQPNTNWDRLVHNLTFSNNVILYHSAEHPLARFLPQLQTDFTISYQVTTKDYADHDFKRTLAQQITGVLPEIGQFDIQRLLSFEAKKQRILIIVKGWMPENSRHDLIELALKSKVKLVFELDNQALLDLADKLSAMNIIATLLIDKANLNNPLTQPAVSPSKPDKKSDKKSKKRLLNKSWFIAMIAIVLIVSISIFFINRQQTSPLAEQPDTKTQALANASSVPTQKKAQHDVKSETSNEAEHNADAEINLDVKYEKNDELSNQALSLSKMDQLDPNMTADQYFSTHKMPAVTEATTIASELNSKTDKNKETSLQPLAESSLPDSAVLSSANTASDSQHQIQQNNDWYLSQNPSHYVIQLGIFTNPEVLAQFDEIDANTVGSIAIYHFSTKFGVTLGLYDTIEDAQKQIQTLPESLKQTGIFAKSIGIIQTQITDN